ncbi:ABC transporter substrate-binding protein [Paraburkholderia xenovorans]|jgi:branched-chain amino acid transport system substrate-binding protein
MMKRSKVGAALALVASVLCWSNASQAEVGVTPTSIRIGMVAPLTSSFAFGSLALLGAEAVYKDVNDSGGVNGRKIELSVVDDACDPNQAIADTKRLISQDQVFMIHGGWCSGNVMAMKPELAANPTLPFMDLGAASASISTPTQPNIFQPVATTMTVSQAMVDFALSKTGAKRVAIISTSDDWGRSHLNPILADLKAKGLTPVENVTMDRGDTDATSQVLRIKATKPDFVLAVLYAPELTIYVRSGFRYGLNAPIVTTEGVSIEDMVKRVGNPAATKQLFVFYPLSQPLNAPGFRKWVDMYRKYNPGQPVETISFMGMTGALAIVEALKHAGPDLTREKFIAQLNNLKGFDPGVQSGPLTFSATQHAGINSGKMIYWANGDPKIVASYPGQSQ